MVVLIDEAHRTQYGSLNSELQAAFPEAKFFAFTGTPIPKTHRTFGAVKDGSLEAYLDRYSIKDAIDDKATVEVRWNNTMPSAMELISLTPSLGNVGIVVLPKIIFINGPTRLPTFTASASTPADQPK